jgi:hypothetical protein
MRALGSGTQHVVGTDGSCEGDPSARICIALHDAESEHRRVGAAHDQIPGIVPREWPLGPPTLRLGGTKEPQGASLTSSLPASSRKLVPSKGASTSIRHSGYCAPLPSRVSTPCRLG